MSVKIMSLVWDNFTRGGTEKLIMLAMADWCNDSGGSLYPSMSAISKKTNITEGQARRVVHKLIEDGYLSVIGNFNGGAIGNTRQYQLNIKMILTPSVDATRTPSVGDTPSADATPSMDAHLPLAPMHITPSVDASLTTNKPSIEPSIKNKAKEPAFVLPDWINKTHWDAWHKNPKRKNLSNEQKQLAVQQLMEWKDAGIDYALALKNSATNNWQGLFEPKQNLQIAKQKQSRMDISGIDYKAGVNADGSF